MMKLSPNERRTLSFLIYRANSNWIDEYRVWEAHVPMSYHDKLALSARTGVEFFVPRTTELSDRVWIRRQVLWTLLLILKRTNPDDYAWLTWVLKYRMADYGPLGKEDEDLFPRPRPPMPHPGVSVKATGMAITTTKSGITTATFPELSTTPTIEQIQQLMGVVGEMVKEKKKGD